MAEEEFLSQWRSSWIGGSIDSSVVDISAMRHMYTVCIPVAATDDDDSDSLNYPFN